MLGENVVRSSSRQAFDPRVKFVGITAPLYQILDLARSLPRSDYMFHVEKRIVRFLDNLKFVGIERSFYIVTGQVLQLISNGRGG